MQVVDPFDARREKPLTAKRTRDREGLYFRVFPSCDFVSFVVKIFNLTHYSQPRSYAPPPP